MIDESETVYYFGYGVLSLCLLVAYIRSRSNESTLITTKEFQIFQTGYVFGYAGVILGELIASASFYHVFISLNLSLYQITKLYLATAVSATIANIGLEIFDLGTRKNKCLLSSVLYSISMCSMFVGGHGHYELLMMGRVVYGAAQALQHSAFESYAVVQHASNGFPEEWLSYTFTYLTHIMALLAVLSGFFGEMITNFGFKGCVFLSLACFALSSFYIMIVWEKDINTSKFMLSGFMFNLTQSINAVKSNKVLFYMLTISALYETAILIFAYYWAPWLTELMQQQHMDINVTVDIPYEIIFSALMVVSMLSNYMFSMYINSQSQNQSTGSSNSNYLLYNIDIIFQTSMVAATVGLVIASVVSLPTLGFGVALAVQACLGVYWPAMGYFRGKIIVPELRNTTLLLPKITSVVLTLVILTSIHHNSFLILICCAGLTGGASYIHYTYIDSKQWIASTNADDDDDDDEVL